MPEPELKLKGNGGDRRAGESAFAELVDFVDHHQGLTVLSGAGCSTGSGIPEYRDDAGNWKHRKPLQLAEFVSCKGTRKRYWAQGFAGWNRISAAKPGAAHVALARLEKAKRIRCVITQNVDNLHREAGSRRVIELHGVMHRVRCLHCGATLSRGDFQERLAELNPEWAARVHEFTPDGDARLDVQDFDAYAVPDCEICGGILKPDVVFFGEPVPRDRVEQASEAVRRSCALLVVGSSLMVFSGFRFARMAWALGKPIGIVNRGTTRADHLAAHKVTADCGTILSRLADHFTKETSGNARRLDSGL
jgi:NAD-dependent SIR2 family protein deacetylase